MKKILILGAGGQIGSELVPHLRAIYGNDNVIATDVNAEKCKNIAGSGPFEPLNALDGEAFNTIVKKHRVDTIFNLVALLSATGERDPRLAWDVNIGALTNSLYIGKENHCAVFTPSSIGAFGNDTPKDNTPQDTLQRANTTIYGV
ncbi:MAG: NAD-dependent epimerase/dehydratase family protein, partial [Odoribacteraceae bacterium]|nr:NAD-dependent epimerase/dehydratase family protein [Odoribacteraceae bacterium]